MPLPHQKARLAKHPKNSSSRTTPHHKISVELQQRILTEAKQLGLTSNEYLRLILALSTTLRKSIPGGPKMNGKQLLAFVDNPIFSLVLQSVIGTIMKQTENSEKNESETKSSINNQNELPESNEPPTVQNQNGYPQNPYLQQPQATPSQQRPVPPPYAWDMW